MSLPTLNWSQTAYQPTGYLTPTDAQVIDALIANAGAMLTKWRVISSVASTYIEFGGQVGSNAENNRIIVGINPTAGYASPDTSASAIWAGYSPTGGTLGTWNSATPYGAGVRFSGYWRAAATALVESFYFIESEETLAIVFRDDSLDRYYFYMAGAFINPLTGDAEGDGRVYAVTTSDSTYVNGTFWLLFDQFLSHHVNNGSPHMGIFRPYTPSIFDPIRANDTTDITASSTMVFSNSNELLAPRFYSTNQSPRYCVGTLRQMYISQDRANRTNTSEGFVFSPSSASADTVLFGKS